MFGKLKETTVSLKDKSAEFKTKSVEFKNSVNEKVQEYMCELNDLLPAIKEIGYEMNEIEVVVGVPPKIIPHFYKTKDVSEDIIEKVLEKYSDKKISTLVLSSLIKASSMQNLINIGNLKFTEVEIELGLIPTVKIKFLPVVNQLQIEQ